MNVSLYNEKNSFGLLPFNQFIAIIATFFSGTKLTSGWDMVSFVP